MAGTAGPAGDRDQRSLAQQLEEDDDAILMSDENGDVGAGVTKFLDEPGVQESIPVAQPKMLKPPPEEQTGAI